MCNDNAATVYKTIIDKPKMDYIARITTDSKCPSTYNIQHLSDTRAFAYSYLNVFRENMVLKNIVKNLWENHEYNREYISFLLNCYTKEEFLDIAKRYAISHEPTVNINDLDFSIRLLFSFLNEPLTSSELSIFLNVPSTTIDSGLKSLGYTPVENTNE